MGNKPGGKLRLSEVVSDAMNSLQLSSHGLPLVSEEAKRLSGRFDTTEILVLHKTYIDMADRSNGKGIDKETFVQYFPLNGLLGDRLFFQFDKKRNGCIDFDEFIIGLGIACRGSEDEKIRFVFSMYNASMDDKISKDELMTLINHVPKELLSSSSIPNSPRNLSRNSFCTQTVDMDLEDSYCSSVTTDGELIDDEDVNHYTNNEHVERAFENCDLKHEGRLSYQEFKMWMQRNPALLNHLESILPYNGIKDETPHHRKEETLPHMKRIASRQELVRSRSSSNDSLQRMISSCRTDSCSELSELCNIDPEEQVRLHLIQARDMTSNSTLKQEITKILEMMPQNDNIHVSRTNTEVYNEVILMKAYLWKKGQSIFQGLVKRYYLLHGNCMYYYQSESDLHLKGVIFLEGSLIDKIVDVDMEQKGYHGFEIIHQDLCITGEHHRHDKRVLYVKSERERDMWVAALQRAAHVVPFEDDYVIGKELGRGRFSIVYECVNKKDSNHHAVKKIDKSTIAIEDKALLRSEIAVLKLLNHPNIIKLEGIYENKTHIYIVMEMIKGGELFDRVVGRPRLTESEAAKLIKPVLESVAYLHEMGIVHRDLKPENIICGTELDDLKIADFGLSKIILPTERMDTACGTLSYVAPEVLTMKGYGKEADLWSVGVIMFLVMCGKLPFDGKDHDEIIQSTIKGEYKVHPTIWSKFSEEAKSMLASLLNTSPVERITAKDALKHPFIAKHFPLRKRAAQSPRTQQTHSPPTHSPPTHSPPTYSPPTHSPPTQSSLQSASSEGSIFF